MKILSTILSAVLLLQVSVCTTFAAAADPACPTANADCQPVEVSLAGCGIKKRHAARQVRQGSTVTKSYSATSTETAAPQTVKVPVQCPTACPTTTLVQPAVCDQPTQIVQPVVVARHRSLLPLLVLGAAAIATAITLPIVLTHHGHHNNNALLAQRQLLLLQRATP